MATENTTRTLSVWIIGVLLLAECVFPIEARVINQTGATDSGTMGYAIGKCRQRCFLMTLENFMFRNDIDSPESFKPCRRNPSCFMCYDYCRVLTVAEEDLAKAMCTDRVFCSKGCRIACQFHRIKSVDALIHAMINNT